MTKIAIKVLVGLFVLTVPSWAHSQVRGLEPIKIGYSGIGIAHDLLKVMRNNQIFEKHGLSAQTIYIGSGSLMNQAVVGGSIDFTTSDLPSQIQAAIAGVDFKIISVTINRLDGAIMTLKQIRKPEDLKGKRLAISRFGSVSDIVTRMVLRHWKLEPIKDVAIIQVGNTPTRIAAILSGQVDGGLINLSDVAKLASSGCCSVLADLGSLDIPYARFGVAALGSLLKARPETARKLLEAFVEGIYHYKTHPEEGIAALRARGVEPGVAKEIYQKVADSYRSRIDPDLSGIKGVLDSLPDERAKEIRPETVMDPTPWGKVAASGYVESLYGKKGVPQR
ncbi:MAG: ABC transporter substrate-binding protein [Deltaproteobacteria bacterium]|nr:ABC transporter substrate-binding protein [Deltaproteobacteria bacterium]